MEEDKRYKLKIVLAGDSESGKTSLIKKYVEDVFLPEKEVTISGEFLSKVVKIKDKIVDAQIWDTGGQERFRTITSSYYRSCSGVILVCDVTSEQSFQNLRIWIEDVERNTNIGTNVAIILVANKCDLESQRVVSRGVLEEWAKANNTTVFETSAKTGKNVNQSFECMLESALDLYLKRSKKEPSSSEQLLNSSQPSDKGCKCTIL